MANEIKIKTVGAVVPSLDDMIRDIEVKTGQKADLRTSSAIGKRMMQEAQVLLRGDNAVLLVDCSGSMSSIEDEAKEGAYQFINEALKKRYNIGIVGFGSPAWVQSEIQKDGEMLGREINKMKITGTTDMAGAFRLGHEMLQKKEARAGTIYMVTDGMPDDRDTTVAEVEKAKAFGYEIMCLGIGAGADKGFLQLLATREDLVEMCEKKDTKKAIGGMSTKLRSLPAPKRKKR